MTFHGTCVHGISGELFCAACAALSLPPVTDDTYAIHNETGEVLTRNHARALMDANVGEIRQFATGATRDTETGKLDFEGFLDPEVLWEFAKYMDGHRHQADGALRASDNWQKGIPQDVYMKSLLRHVVDLWMLHRGHGVVRPEDGHVVTFTDALAACLFNIQGYWHEALRTDDRITF